MTEVRAVITQQEGAVSCNFAEVEAYRKSMMAQSLQKKVRDTLKKSWQSSGRRRKS